MSVVIELRFPAGQYHATPWGRHVNEGVPEWPPSPWRLLRALVAVWKRTLPEIPTAQMQRILKALAEPPQFRLPPHRVAHTRHYMPWEKKGPLDRTLVFDTFIVVSRHEPLFIQWRDQELPPDDRGVLDRLLQNLSSLGRADGWVESRLINEIIQCDLTQADPADPNPVPVLCLDPNTAFQDDYYPKLDPKKLAAGKIKPADFLFDCPNWHLCLDTETLHVNRWPIVPGSRWVNYTRPAESSAVHKPTRSHRSFTVARFLLDGPVLPLVTDTVTIAERFRAAAMRRFEDWCQRREAQATTFRRTDSPGHFSSRILSGKELDGATLLRGHQHAYYLPEPADDDPRRIAHVSIFARGGLGEEEIRALSTLRILSHGEGNRLRVQLVGLGMPDDFRSALFGTSDEFVSVTPFLGPAHLGRQDAMRDMKKSIRREWRRLAEQIPQYQQIELKAVEELSVDDQAWQGRPRPLEYRRIRSKHARDGFRLSGIFRLRFSRELQGPLTLGYAGHFGFGLFSAVE